MKQDADSLFNAGHCLATGTGTVQDLERCVFAGRTQGKTARIREKLYQPAHLRAEL